MKKSCGILLYRQVTHADGKSEWEYLLVHPGGQHNKYSAWGIPKGKKEEGETDIECAIREFQEETNFKVKNKTKLIDLGELRNPNSGKVIHIYAGNQTVDETKIKSNYCDFFWQGQWIQVPEIDDAKWVNIEEAEKICSVFQIQFVKILNNILEG
jgi:predicted NUDIX family NTP pyrophosphohydrolase